MFGLPTRVLGRSVLVREGTFAIVSLLAVLAVTYGSSRLLDTVGVDCTDYPNLSWESPSFQSRVEYDITTPLVVTRPARFLQAFSTECRGRLRIRRSGLVTFGLASRGTATLLIDDRPVVQTQGPPLKRSLNGIDLLAGQHAFQYRFAQQGGADEPELTIAFGDGRLRPVDRYDVSRQPLPPFAHPLLRPARVALLVAPIAWVGLMLYRWRAPLDEWIRSVNPPFVRWHGALTASPARAMIAIAAVGAAVRLALTFGTSPILWPDSVQYYDSALANLRGDFFSHNLLSTPLFPAFMAAFLNAGIRPESGDAMIAAQRVLGVATSLLVYSIARAAFDRRVAFYAALIWTVSAVQLYYETVVATESLFIVFWMATIAVAIQLIQHPSRGLGLSVGAICVVTTMTRPVGKSFLFVILLLMWWVARLPRRRLVLPSVLALVVFAAGVAPWMYVNRQTYGFWGVSAGEGLWLFLRAIDIDQLEPPESTRYRDVRMVYDAFRPGFPYLHYAVRDELNFSRGYSSKQADEAMFGFARETVLAHPVAFALGTIKQWVLLMVAPYRSVQICDARDGPYLCAERSTDLSFRAFPNRPPPDRSFLKRAIAAYVNVAHWLLPLMGPFAIAGMIRSVSRRDPQTEARVLLTAAVLYLSVLTALFNTVQDRYRLPVDAFILMFAVDELRRLFGSPSRVIDAQPSEDLRQDSRTSA